MKFFNFAALLLAAISADAAPLAAPLSERECALIREFEENEEASFVDRFAKMAHQREFCSDQGEDCSVSLRKRVDDFYLIMRGNDSFPTDEVAQYTSEALLQTFGQIYSATGIRPLPGEAKKAKNFIFLIFVDEVTAKHYYDEYVERWITPQSLARSKEEKELLEETFRNFLTTKQPCMALDYINSSGKIDKAQIWIRTDLSQNLMEQCVAEEVYNSFGLSEGVEVGSIFDYRFSHKEGDTSLSEFDLLLLSVLYNDELLPNSNVAQTKQTVEALT